MYELTTFDIYFYIANLLFIWIMALAYIIKYYKLNRLHIKLKHSIIEAEVLKSLFEGIQNMIKDDVENLQRENKKLNESIIGKNKTMNNLRQTIFRKNKKIEKLVAKK